MTAFIKTNMAKVGRPKYEPEDVKTRTLSFRVTEDVYEALKKAADEDQETVTSLVRSFCMPSIKTIMRLYK